MNDNEKEYLWDALAPKVRYEFLKGVMLYSHTYARNNSNRCFDKLSRKIRKLWSDYTERNEVMLRERLKDNFTFGFRALK